MKIYRIAPDWFLSFNLLLTTFWKVCFKSLLRRAPDWMLQQQVFLLKKPTKNSQYWNTADTITLQARIPATEMYLHEELLSKSFAWMILRCRIEWVTLSFQKPKILLFSPVQKHQKQFADVTLVYYNTHIKMGITIYHKMYICFIVSKSRFWLFHGFFMEIFLRGSVGICLYDVGKKKGTRLLCLRLWATPKLGKSTSAWS